MFKQLFSVPQVRWYLVSFILSYVIGFDKWLQVYFVFILALNLFFVFKWQNYCMLYCAVSCYFKGCHIISDTLIAISLKDRWRLERIKSLSAAWKTNTNLPWFWPDLFVSFCTLQFLSVILDKLTVKILPWSPENKGCWWTQITLVNTSSKHEHRCEKKHLAGYTESQIHIARKFGLEALELSIRMTGFFSWKEKYIYLKIPAACSCEVKLWNDFAVNTKFYSRKKQPKKVLTRNPDELSQEVCFHQFYISTTVGLLTSSSIYSACT